MNAPIIKLSPDVELALTTWSLATKGREFSGLGLVEREGNVLRIIGVDLLGVGSTGFTEFSAERQRSLPLDPRRKLWFHRHPVGNGEPGAHNWSVRDERTATQEPLGGLPPLVQWSCSIVLTPGGWVGRVDFYVPTLRTFHCVVEPKQPSEEVVAQARLGLTPDMQDYVEQLLREFEARHGHQGYVVPPEYSYEDFDWSENDSTGLLCPDCSAELTEEISATDLTNSVELPTYSCPDCGNVYVITDHVPAVQQPAWRQTSWWNRLLGGKQHGSY